MRRVLKNGGLSKHVRYKYSDHAVNKNFYSLGTCELITLGYPDLKNGMVILNVPDKNLFDKIVALSV